MGVFRRRFDLATRAHNELVDITREVQQIVSESGLRDGLCSVFTPHATAAITINENDDENIGADFVKAMSKMVVEHDDWLHDRVDNNAAAHIKSALMGPSETIRSRRGNWRWAPGKTFSSANSTGRDASGGSS